jgi:uncharacterized protein (TIGR02145 family)
LIVTLEENNSGCTMGTVTDIDGNIYNTVKIGDQWWMAENLKVTKYNDGTPLQTELSNIDWMQTTNGAYTVYPHENVEGINSNDEMIDAYGILYNWNAIADGRGLCPTGWSVPNEYDWDLVIGIADYNAGYTSGSGMGGYLLQSCRQINSPFGEECSTDQHPRWNFLDNPYGTDYYYSGTNSYCFSLLPSGALWAYGSYEFQVLGSAGFWWSTSETNINGWDAAWAYDLQGTEEYGYRMSKADWPKVNGLAVRCVKD